MSQEASGIQPIEHKERWYTSSESYVLPTDDEEGARLQAQHELLRDLFDGQIVFCPLQLKPGDEVLDVGTGKGSWALDFLASYPGAAAHARVTGIDITDRLFPAPDSAPENSHFEVQNVLSLPAAWTDRFAFVHQRLLMSALKKKKSGEKSGGELGGESESESEWAKDVREVFRVTRPGGWAQFLEANASAHTAGCGPATRRFMDMYEAMAAAVGLDFECALHIGGLMEQAGFTGVKTEHKVVGLGACNGEQGQEHARNLMSVYRGFKTPVLRMGGLGYVRSEEEFDRMADEMEEEWTRPGAAYAFYVVTGQKTQQ